MTSHCVRTSSFGALPPEEPPLQRAEELLAEERPDLRVGSVLLGDAHVVLERRVRRLERIDQLVALEDVVVPAGLVAAPVLRVDRAADRPQRAGQPLDPDHDPLGLAPVVDPVHLAFRKPGGGSLSDAPMLTSRPWSGSRASGRTLSRSCSRARASRTASRPT